MGSLLGGIWEPTMQINEYYLKNKYLENFGVSLLPS